MGFYSTILNCKPDLHVPGMTEFKLTPSTVLGLMPEEDIKQLLGDKLPDPALANGSPRAEVCLIVDDPQVYHRRAIAAGAQELSPLEKRDWGHLADYSFDPWWARHRLCKAVLALIHSAQRIIRIKRGPQSTSEDSTSLIFFAHCL
jgi:hypothetical protein